MSVVSWIAIGALIGLVVQRVMVRRLPIGPRGAAVAGIAGGLTGGGVFALLDGRGVAALDPVTAASALLGAVLVLAALDEPNHDHAAPRSS